MYAPLTTRKPEPAKAAAPTPPPAPAQPRAEMVAPVSPFAPQGPIVGATAQEVLRPEPTFVAPEPLVAKPQPVVSQPVVTPTAQASAREEAQELARWTLDMGDDGLPGSDIPSLAADALDEVTAQPEVVAEPTPVEAPDARLEGATQVPDAEADFSEQVAETNQESVADSLFEAALEPDLGFEAEDDFLMAPPPAPVAPQAKAEEPRAGAVKEAPLETFFDQQSTFIASDIDRKIDEALQLAERMRQPQKKAAQGPDELDVPAFLRNGMKDLPLE
jgi:hypothetical protein